MTFEEKVRAMSSYDIVMTLVNGLRRRWVEPLFTNGFNFAAENAMCEIAMMPLTDEERLNSARRANALGCADLGFYIDVEASFDALRCGNIQFKLACQYYNIVAQRQGFPEIEFGDLVLPNLAIHYTDEDLEAYVKLAELQKEKTA